MIITLLRNKCKLQYLQVMSEYMDVVFRSFAMIREAMGSSKVTIDVKDKILLLETIKIFVKRYPKTIKHVFNNNVLSRNLAIAVNGEEVPYNNISKYQISKNDEIAIIPPAGGG